MTTQDLDCRLADVRVVEDIENDFFLLREGFRALPRACRLHHVEDGSECLAFLRMPGPYDRAPTPDFILLDLNRPVVDGQETMAQIAADEHLCHLSVVSPTTSSNEGDIQQMYQLRCSSHIIKPVDFNQFERVIRLVSEYWFVIATLPSLWRS